LALEMMGPAIFKKVIGTLICKKKSTVETADANDCLLYEKKVVLCLSVKDGNKYNLISTKLTAFLQLQICGGEAERQHRQGFQPSFTPIVNPVFLVDKLQQPCKPNGELHGFQHCCKNKSLFFL
jgi:hypothetical protein